MEICPNGQKINQNFFGKVLINLKFPGRTSSTLTIALPKELIREQRAELVQKLIDQFAGQYQFPYTAVIHNHPSEITGEDQPHLHLMYSERTISDDIERPPEQFFKQYRQKIQLKVVRKS